MMIKSRGPVWHQKQKKQGIIPEGLTGLDKEATWCTSKADGWIYGHGTFCITSHDIPIVGIFQWMPNSGHEAKRMDEEIVQYDQLINTVCFDSKADSMKRYWQYKQDHGIQLITTLRKGADKSQERKDMIADMMTEKNKHIYKQRSTTVEPMQGLMANIFELNDGCWMRGNSNNRWLFAAMGIAVQIAQLHAYRDNRSTWAVKSEVLGV